MMKQTSPSFFLAVILLTCSFFAAPVSAQQMEEKEPGQIMEEYERWSGIRDDWPDLNRYRKANKKLAPPAPDEKRVVFMGNSITEGWLNIYPAFFEGKPYINRGIGGQTTPQMLVRFRQDVIALEPAAVVILAGTNDLAGNTGPSTVQMIEDNLRSMAELAAANEIEVILVSVLPVADYPWKPGLEPAQKIVELNQRIQAYAAENNFTYLDLFTTMADHRNGMKPEYSPDEVHPNLEGYKVMSVLTEKTITAVLGSR